MRTAAQVPAHAAQCHSLVLRLPAPAEAEGVRRRLQEVASRRPEHRGVRLWETRVTGDDGVDREATRPLSRSHLVPRIVLAYQQDGSAALILVARRSLLTKAALFELAALLAGGSQGAPQSARADGMALAAPGMSFAGWPEVAWGLGERCRTGAVGVLSTSLERGDETILVAATALVLSRYDVAPGAFELDPGMSISDLLDRVALSGNALRFGDDRTVAPVGMFFGGWLEGYEYRPCLAPLFPLTFSWERRGDGSYRGRCWYDCGFVSPTIADRFARHVVHVAGRLATARGDELLAGIDPLASEERDEILRCGATAAPPGSICGPQRIDQMFAEVARAHPDAPAVSDADATLTYRELDVLAERLAAGLRTVGVRPGEPVGVCLEPGISLVAVLLAVHRAGGAYVPMDIRNPPERLAFMAQDAGVSVVVTVSGFPDVEGVRRITFHELERADGGSAGRAGTSLGPHAAYVIYTSGSTGRPKGVVVPHANVIALIRATQDEFALGPADVWTFFHSSAFDFSVWEIWGCLLTGGRLVVVPYWVSRSPEEFRRLLEDEGVTVLSQTPSAFGQLIEADQGMSRDPGPPSALRLVVLGGESLDTRMLAPWFARHSPSACRVVNMFGITETTVHVTMRTVVPADTEIRSRNVGCAIPGWSVSVRDGSGRILPYGAIGEIYVGGAGVALGYLGRPGLTAERFVVDGVNGQRVYRSGDRGRLRPDGSLDHLGRMDSQVKVRGHRIELDEIRTVLMEDPAVVQAAVVLDGHGAGTSGVRIAAYAVLKPGTSQRAVLRNCALLLPDYMVPATLTEVEAMPLTINGKLDAQRLPASTPTTVPAGESLDLVEDRTDPLVDTVLKLWSRHLETTVGVTDNFFEHGGNSLLVVRMLSDLKGLGLPTPAVRQFYGNSTVARFSELLRGLISQTSEAQR